LTSTPTLASSLIRLTVQSRDREVHSWRAQLIRTLSEGGLCLEPEKALGDERRRLADARKTQAKNLKDRFLNGPARFLLRDQEDAAGIEKLELRLVKEFDLALKFSCKVWSRPDMLRIKGLEDLAGQAFSRTSRVMELCPGQAPLPTGSGFVSGTGVVDQPPAYHEGHGVVMAIQPAIESVSPDYRGSMNFEEARVLSKARVLVSAPSNLKGEMLETTKSPSWAWSPHGWVVSPATGTVDGMLDVKRPDVLLHEMTYKETQESGPLPAIPEGSLTG